MREFRPEVALLYAEIGGYKRSLKTGAPGCRFAGLVRQDLLIPSRPHALIVQWYPIADLWNVISRPLLSNTLRAGPEESVRAFAVPLSTALPVRPRPVAATSRSRRFTLNARIIIVGIVRVRHMRHRCNVTNVVKCNAMNVVERNRLYLKGPPQGEGLFPHLAPAVRTRGRALSR
jgi:hypothetical protein